LTVTSIGYTLYVVEHHVHNLHEHRHGDDCGHLGIQHDDHVDYVHDAHLHHVHGEHVDEHEIAASQSNPNDCSAGHTCAGHPADHVHGVGCGHDVVPHAGHIDYVVAGHIHRRHGTHCDDHGPLPAYRAH